MEVDRQEIETNIGEYTTHRLIKKTELKEIGVNSDFQ